MRTILFVGLLGSLSQAASASCVWTWDCTHGPCRQIPLCDSTLDIPPPRPPQVAPIAPPSIPPIGVPMVPPIGTQSCAPTRIRITSGNVCGRRYAANGLRHYRRWLTRFARSCVPSVYWKRVSAAQSVYHMTTSERRRHGWRMDRERRAVSTITLFDGVAVADFNGLSASASRWL